MCDCLNNSLNEGVYKALNTLCVEYAEPADFKCALESPRGEGSTIIDGV